jgi:hypothetical protein
MNAQDAAIAPGIFGESVYSYSRAQALDDGYLVDVTETAREAGFRFPVALTRAAWEDCVAWSEDDTTHKHWPQDEAGRLWDVLMMARFLCKRDAGASRITFQVLRVPREGRGVKPRKATLLAAIGSGDDAEPVITIGLPHDF